MIWDTSIWGDYGFVQSNLSGSPPCQMLVHRQCYQKDAKKIWILPYYAESFRLLHICNSPVHWHSRGNLAICYSSRFWWLGNREDIDLNQSNCVESQWSNPLQMTSLNRTCCLPEIWPWHHLQTYRWSTWSHTSYRASIGTTSGQHNVPQGQGGTVPHLFISNCPVFSLPVSPLFPYIVTVWLSYFNSP